MFHGKSMACCFVLLGTLTAFSDDWPSWRGPERTGVSNEKGLLKSWPKQGPTLLWTFKDCGNGYSTPAVVKDRVYVTGAFQEEEYLFALDLKGVKSGESPKVAWKVKIGPRFKWKRNIWNTGPSATPTVDDHLIFAVGGFGDLICVDSTGKTLWSKNLPKELGAEVNPFFGGLEEPTPLGWGFTWTPFVDGEKLIILPGGKQGLFAALNKKDGKLLWQSKDLKEQATYSSPIAGTVGGKKFYFALFQQGVAAVTPEGAVALHYKREREFGDVVIPTPIIADDHLHLTVAGEEKKGCVCLKLTLTGNSLKAEEVYNTESIANYIGGVVKVGDYVYGYSQRPRAWVCQEFKTGKIVWEEEKAAKQGSLIAADGHLFLFDETNGTCVLAEANPKEFIEKGRLTLPQRSKINLPSGRIWTPPVIANGMLFLRDQDLLFCYDIKAK